MRIYKTGYVLSLEEEKRVGYRHLINRFQPLRKTKTLAEVERSGAPYYKFVASTSDTCASCAALHGMAFHISDAEEGINLPPLHPNCKCDIEPYNFEDYLSSDFPNDNPGGVTPNDWQFFGRSGDEFHQTPDEIYTDDYFGKAIKSEDYQDLHIVDWLARLLFHETSDSSGQAAIAWTIFNRIESTAIYTGRDSDTGKRLPHTLFNILNSPNQYHAYEPSENTNPQQPNFFNPTDWVESLTEPYKSQQKRSWDSALELAKRFVSAYGSHDPDRSTESRRAAFEMLISNPFPDRVNNEKIDASSITDYLAYETDSLQIDVGGNSFGHI